jgi:heterotetrameric sarcosine oxidase delta subunit
MDRTTGAASMILIPCPHCGPRNSSEFAYVGERKARPDPNTATPVAWRAYLYDKRNPAGWTTESWYHRFGCRKYLVVERHTVTNEVRAAHPAGGWA